MITLKADQRAPAHPQRIPDDRASHRSCHQVMVLQFNYKQNRQTMRPNILKYADSDMLKVYHEVMHWSVFFDICRIQPT